MALDSTPTSRSHRSTSTHTSTEQPPATPQLPFEPPLRRSSLAFSKMTESPLASEDNQLELPTIPIIATQTPSIHSNIGRKRTADSPHVYSGIPPGHVASIQKVLHTARANLHLDMRFAASPVGSIDSRLPTPYQEEENRLEDDLQTNSIEQSWRYSHIPEFFSATVSDVREPVPDSSPTLPRMIAWSFGDDDVVEAEPTSSGFASPLSAGRESLGDREPELPPLPTSSPAGGKKTKQDGDLALHDATPDGEDISELTQPMTGLKVASESDVRSDQEIDQIDESPIINHLRRRSCTEHASAINIPKCPDSIFLSQSARAAAESARAKRGLHPRVSDDAAIQERSAAEYIWAAGVSGHNAYRSRVSRPVASGDLCICPDPSAHYEIKSSCPDPEVHRLATYPCPDPGAHNRITTSQAFADNLEAIRAHPRAWGNRYLAPEGTNIARAGPRMTGGRTTAAGSPMPFAKRTKSPPMYSKSYTPRGPLLPSPSPLSLVCLPHSELPQHESSHHQRSSEHFQPGWHYPSRAAEHYGGRSPNPYLLPIAAGKNGGWPGLNLYSFSTAAAKVTGESAAPDSRIRDSYRTDTLTPLARPPGRFRKTGIAATLQPSRSRRYHKGPPRRSSYGRLPPDLIRRFDAPYLHSTQSRSSPTRPSARYMSGSNIRKRNNNDHDGAHIKVHKDQEALSIRPSLRLHASEEVIQVDKDTRAAVRMSVFGSNTPEYLQGEREGIRELSPNVNVWRKGLSSGPPYRKKRRPSYWDDDLEEVRMSPAGRGGIASSPPLSKRSMIAELENIPSQVGSIVTDESAPLDYEGEATEEACNDMQEVNMTDINELEA